MRRTLFAALAAFLLLAVPASASIRSKIIADCTDDGVLQGSYTPSQLHDARKHLPSDVAEYSDCADVLRRAELPASPSSSSSAPTTSTPAPGQLNNNGGAAAVPLTPSTPQDTQAIQQAKQAPGTPVKVGGQNLLAGAAPLRQGYRANGLPDSLKIALILLAVAGVALSLPPVRRRLRALRRR